MALADQRHQEIRHAHTSSSYRPGFNFASMATGVIKGIDLGARSPSLPAVIRALAGKLRVSCGRRVRGSSSRRAIPIGRRRHWPG